MSSCCQMVKSLSLREASKVNSIVLASNSVASFCAQLALMSAIYLELNSFKFSEFLNCPDPASLWSMRMAVEEQWWSLNPVCHIPLEVAEGASFSA